MIKRLVFLILILLVFWFTLYSEKVAELHELLKPGIMMVDDTQLYVTQDATVFIYSLRDYKLKKKFGSAGQGPQEFSISPQIPLIIDVNSNQIFINSIGKISYYSKSGEFIKEIKLSSLALFLQQLGENYLGLAVTAEDKVRYKVVNLYNGKLEKIKEVYRAKHEFQGPGQGIKVLTKPFLYQAYKGKILLPGSDDSSVNVFDDEMKKLFSIKLKQKKLKIDQSFKDEVIQYIKNDPSTKDIYEILKPIEMPEYFPIIAAFFVTDDTIYVMTWKIENSTNEFFTYDMQGNFKKRVVIPIKYQSKLKPYPISIKNGKLYQIVENEDEEIWEFHCSTIK